MAELGDRRLQNSWQGALAGGGDPASSPLYVFGPFLSLIVAAGVAKVTFGPSIWLAVVTIVVVSLLYRLVMRWIVDGSGGTGLSEEELGPWAAKISAAITCIEYTLTFLVSIAALVTFVADRAGLRSELLGVDARTWLALGVAVTCGALVNRGPRMVSLVFGPATAAVLVLLWTMMIATVARRGFHLAPFDVDAFTGRYLGYTLGGFVRILALMTGIEVFANLVASYAGPPALRSRRAFTSLAIIMGSTSLTMVVVGPAILAVANPARPNVSVFTQTMDALLPHPLALIGTGVGVLVLLSAAAASALGIQNLFLGLSVRHYAPAALASPNRVGVAARPVWLEVGTACIVFLLLGSDEAKYLAVYAAGVFVLLSMTGWAAVLRVFRRRRQGDDLGIGTLVAVIAAALFTSTATVVIFIERFADGVWMYFVLVPALAGLFGLVRRVRGHPGPTVERIGRLLSRWSRGDHTLLDLDPDSGARDVEPLVRALQSPVDAADGGGFPDWRDPAGPTLSHVRAMPESGPWRVAVPLDGSALAERALPYVLAIGRYQPIEIHLVHVHETGDVDRAHEYLDLVSVALRDHGAEVIPNVVVGSPASAILAHIVEHSVAVVVMTSHGRTGVRRVIAGSVALEVVSAATCSVLTVPGTRSVRQTSDGTS